MAVTHDNSKKSDCHHGGSQERQVGWLWCFYNDWLLLELNNTPKSCFCKDRMQFKVIRICVKCHVHDRSLESSTCRTAEDITWYLRFQIPQVQQNTSFCLQNSSDRHIYCLPKLNRPKQVPDYIAYLVYDAEQVRTITDYLLKI